MEKSNKKQRTTRETEERERAMGDGGMDGDRDLWDRLGTGGFGGRQEARHAREGRGRIGVGGGKAATRAKQ